MAWQWLGVVFPKSLCAADLVIHVPVVEWKWWSHKRWRPWEIIGSMWASPLEEINAVLEGVWLVCTEVSCNEESCPGPWAPLAFCLSL